MFEVLAVDDVPASALSGTSAKARAADYRELGVAYGIVDSERRSVFDKFAHRRCAIALQKMAGFADLRIGEKSAEQSLVGPTLSGFGWWFSVVPKEQWLAGQTKFICHVRWTDPASAADFPPSKAVVSPDSKPAVAHVREAALPLAFRLCYKSAEGGRLPCSKPHFSQSVAAFDINGTFDEAFVSAIDPDHLTAAQKEAFADACNDLLPQMLGKNYDATRVRPFAGIAGWGDDGKFAYCDVAAIDDTPMLGAGSLIARK